MSIRIDEGFVKQLVEHPTFKTEISRLTQRSNVPLNPESSPRRKDQPQKIEAVVDEICEMLSEEVRTKVERESLEFYESHLQALKDIEHLKEALTARTATSSPSK